MNISWLFKMALRDSRTNKGRLLLFMSSIVLGIGALVAINSFGENLSRQIENDAKELLGADLEVSSRTPISDKVRARFDSLNFQTSEEISFASMAYFPKNGGTRLVNVRAVEPGFPFYGTIETKPENGADGFTKKDQALADQTLMLQFDASVGDSVKIGNVKFDIAARVLKVPGRSAITTTVAPPVFIPFNSMQATGLLQLGSRMNYKIYAKYPDHFDAKKYDTYLKPWLETLDLDFDDVNQRKESIGDAYSNLTGFLNLTAFVALILGCVGVAGSVSIYIKEKVKSVAVLRCMGATGRQAMAIYLIQVVIMGLVGSVIGAALGAGIQFLLPGLFSDFLPVSVGVSLSYSSIIQGVLLGVIAALLFALPPLLRIRKVSPLKAIRASFESETTAKSPYFVYFLILIFILSFSWIQLDNLFRAAIFTAGLLIAFGLLTGVAKAIIWLVRSYFPTGRSFVLRQGLSNLYRPNNQTLILIVTIGLGTALIATLLISQELLIDKLKFSSASENRPNMVLFDIQSKQLDRVEKLVTESDFPVLGQVPIVTMRLESVKGRSVSELRADSASKVSDGMLNREYRVTYRDSLTDAEKIVDGEWKGKHSDGEPIFISMDDGFAERMGVGVGDELVFNVQGALMKTTIGSLREIDFQRVTTNFLVLFPEGVLEDAPKFHVILTRFNDPDESAALQSKIVAAFPNISIIDLELVLNTVDEVLGKVSFVIQFMAFFSIFTGIIVLLGSVLLSKYQRIQESVLLRTLGAQRHHIIRINFLEYLILGSLAALTGICIALIAGWLLAWLSFDTVLTPNPGLLLIMYLAITGLTILIGLSNSRDVLRKPPLEILRNEA